MENGKMKLKVLRTIADLTMEDVANKIGVNRNTYASWEKYETFPNAVQLVALSRIFGCSMDSFYFPTETN